MKIYAFSLISMFFSMIVTVLAQQKYNIVFFMADDLKASAIPPYINPDHPLYDQKLHPKYNEFVQTAVAFNAVAAQTVCGPTRTSMLTGRFPDRTKVHTFQRLIPQIAPKISTIFRYSKDVLNLETCVSGKIYHTYGATNNQIEYYTGELTRKRVSIQSGNSECGSYWGCVKPRKSLSDTDVIKQANAFIKEMSTKPQQRWILGVGVHRPHLTISITAADSKGIKGDLPDYTTPAIPGTVDFLHSLAYRQDDETGRYKVSFGRLGGMQRIVQNERKSSLDLFQNRYNTAVANLRSAYYAGAHATLNNFGLVLDQIAAYGFKNNTIVIFSADHGWQIGERRMIGKNSLYAESTDIPLLISVPNLTNGGIAKYPASARDIFPTIIELMRGSAAVANFNDGTGMPLDGKSLVPALTNLNFKVNEGVISQYPRCQDLGTVQTLDCMTGPPNESCAKGRPIIKFMGYMYKTEKHRYIEWRKFTEVRTECAKPTWPNMPAELNGIGDAWWQIDPQQTKTDWNSAPLQPELYVIGDERNNLAVNPTATNQALMNQYSGALKQKLQGL